MGISSPAFKEETESQSIFLTFAIFQMPLTQKNPYAKATYFRVAFAPHPSNINYIHADVQSISRTFHFENPKLFVWKCLEDAFPCLQLPQALAATILISSSMKRS